MELSLKFISTGFLVLCIASVWWFLDVFWWRPKALAAKLHKQGIQGPPPKFLMGNLVEIVSLRREKKEKGMDSLTHDIVGHVLPDFVQWSQEYGNKYVHWWGTEPSVMIHEPELIRDVFAKRLSVFMKSEGTIRAVASVTGRGLAAVQGEEWAAHRRVVAPAFYVEKLKEMVPTISDCANRMLDTWEMKTANDEQEVEVSEEFQKLTADVISHTAFGSNYTQGKRVFDILQEIPQQQRKIMQYGWIPFLRFLPLPVNLKIMSLEREINTILLNLVRDRKTLVKSGGSESYGNDLLGLLLAESEGEKSSILNDKSIAGECRTFYLAGHETTSVLLSWTVMLLAAYPEWQDRARAEVLADDDGTPDSEVFNKYKLMKMIFNEALRLYPPVTTMIRTCFEDTQLGDLHLPKGVGVVFPVIAIHRSPEFWGPDAEEFNPERFRDGISSACKHPNAFLPFSLGPRVCVGQAFALLEAKVVLAAILRRFSFKLSPNYRHNPSTMVTLRPYNGLPIILAKLDN